MQPDLTVSRTYTSPMCFQDSIDKELMAERSLLDPLPDLKVKGQKIELSDAVPYFWKDKNDSAVYSSAVAVRRIIHFVFNLFFLINQSLRTLSHKEKMAVTLEGITN